MQQSSGTASYRFYKIPHFESTGQQGTIVGILDASGSMSSYWKFLAQVYNDAISKRSNVITITFDTNVKQKESPELSERINDHGGGGTDIVLPFNTLNNLITNGHIKTENLTVIFVSDGADSYSHTLNQRLDKLKSDIASTKKLHSQLRINFLCVAVGTGFPTFIAMAFREMYHTGDATAPPVFLIEPKEGKHLEVFTEEFMNLVPFLGHEEQVSLEPALYKYPWDSQPVQKVYANSWVCSKDYSDKVFVKGQISTITVDPIDEPFSIHTMLEIIKEWVQSLSLLSLKGPAVEQGKVALEIAIRFRENLLGNKKVQKLSFADRMKLRGKASLEENYNELVREIRKYAESEIISKLTQEEAAKRLAIGTKVGKYHNVAMKLKGITVQDYVVARDYFIKLLQETKCDFTQSAQEPSVIIMQNQKDVFGEPDLIEGLKLCPSQYDLVETFPIVGHGIQVIRKEGALINPWMIQVISVAKHHKIVDSVTLQQKGNQLEFQTGNGDTEVINCILPLFKLNPDGDIAPFIQSRLYHILMTFAVMQNADTMFESAFSALLANTLIFLIQQPKSSWRDDLLDLIYETSKMTYYSSKNFQNYTKALIETPNTALVTEHPDIQTKCEDPSKAIYALFYIMRDQPEVFGEKKEQILQRIFCETFGRLYPNETPIEQFYEISNKEELQKLDFSKYVNNLLGKFSMNTLIKDYYTLPQLKGELSTRVSQLNIASDVSFSVTFDVKRLFWINADRFKFNLKCIQSISEFFLGREQTVTEFEIFTYHAQIRNSLERANRPINQNLEEINQTVSRLKTSAVLSNNPIFNDTFNKLAEVYRSQMLDTHFKVLPMDAAAVNHYCQQKGIQNTYKFNTVSNLFKNSCMSVTCPHFMVINPSLSTHLESHPGLVPAFHKTIKLNYDLPAEEIYVMIQKGKCLQNDNPHVGINSMISAETKQRFIDRKTQILDVIEMCREIYKNIK